MRVIGAVAANDWLEHTGERSGRPYWRNQRTGEQSRTGDKDAKRDTDGPEQQQQDGRGENRAVSIRVATHLVVHIQHRPGIPERTTRERLEDFVRQRLPQARAGMSIQVLNNQLLAIKLNNAFCGARILPDK
eukprot:COSAG06_NODE_25800_length_628_cov_1.272212_2_plen_132_part_00